MKNRTASRWCLVMVCALIGACSAPVELENPLAAPLEKCQSALASCQSERKDCLASLDRVTRELDVRTAEREASVKALGDVKAELNSCLAQAAGLEKQTDELSQTRDRLNDQLKASIAQKDVEIELLKGKLSVRVLDRVLFASGSATIRPEGLSVLGKIAAVLVSVDEAIRVEGHTDDVPISAALKSRYPTNWELSGARAASVVRYFEDRHQIAGIRMEAVGHSFFQPVAANDSDENRQRNRRVEVVLTARK